MFTPRTHQRLLAIAAFLVALFAIVAFAMWPLRDCIRWYGRPVAGILLDPDGQVSSFGLPT